MRTKIKTLREGKGISQSQMAERLNMDERNYMRIESGERKLMDTEMLMRIAEVLDVDVADLLVNETVNIENNDIHDNQNGAGYIAEAVANQFPPNLKTAYEDMMKLMRELIAEKNETIKLLKELKGK
jgi:transcriptional regulator with XRE-family HTH domain